MFDIKLFIWFIYLSTQSQYDVKPTISGDYIAHLHDLEPERLFLELGLHVPSVEEPEVAPFLAA